MTELNLYPLRFTPIYQYRLWGGRRLEQLMKEPLPEGLVGEAWLLSDRDDHASMVAEGPLKGQTIKTLFEEHPDAMMGKFAGQFKRFPLLLKFLDASQVLSVQVHPSDAHPEYIPAGENGKTEAWVVLETETDSLIYAGLTPGTTPENLRESIADNQFTDHLYSFKPSEGDSVLIKAGTVHTLRGLVVFEVQQNSDITFRLYDWDRTDEKTGKPRELQVEQALAVIDYHQVDIGSVEPVTESAQCEHLLQSDYFIVWRHQGDHEFETGATNEPRVLICTEGEGSIIFNDNTYPIAKGNVILLPAITGKCPIQPNGFISLLEVGIPPKN